jgi:phage recombination protein Bet
VPKQKTKRKPTKRKTRKPTTTAIVSVAPPAQLDRARRQHGLSREDVALLKQTICKGITESELAMFLWVAKKHKLDPMTRQLHAVKRFVTKHHQDEKGIWVGGEQMSIQIGIDGYRSMAAVNHKDFGGVDEPEYEFADGEKRIPTLARVRVWKKGFDHPSVGVAYWDEYAPAGLDADKAFMWKKMPKHMLAKCAEALALRKAYPDLADIYTDEEMHQHDQDFTPSGRQITDADGFAPSGRAVTYAAHAKGQIEAEVERQKTGAAPSSQSEMHQPATQPPKAQIPNEPIDVKPEPVSKGIVEIDETDEAHPIIRGALAEILPQLQERCKTMVWKDDWWHIEPRDVENAKTLCVRLGFRVLEILPKAEPKKPAAKEAVAPKATQPAGKREANTPAGPVLMVGIIEQAATESGKSPRVSVLLKIEKAKHWMSAFDTALFAFLIGGKGQEAELFVTKTTKGDKTFTNIVGLKRVGSKHFDADGKTPVIQNRGREAGGQTLFT